MDEDAMFFRKERIKLIHESLIKEIDKRIPLREKYKKASAGVDWVNTGLILTGTVVGSLGGASVIGAPLGISIGSVCVAIGLGGKFLSKKLNQKLKKHEGIILLTESTIHGMDIEMSKILEDDIITDKEFERICILYEKYWEKKKKLKSYKDI